MQIKTSRYLWVEIGSRNFSSPLGLVFLVTQKRPLEKRLGLSWYENRFVIDISFWYEGMFEQLEFQG